jgi:hypothetical protein
VLELLSWGAQLLLVVIAIGAAFVAAYQLREMGRYRSQRLQIANAQFLMNLDDRWDSQRMQESRVILNAMRENIMKKVGSANPTLNDAERTRHIKQEWIASLQDKRDNSPDEYAVLMSFCGFFETVGLMVDRQYVQNDDVFELFLGPIIDVATYFGGHIAELEKETGMPEGLYRHALNLAREGERRAEAALSR